MSSELTLKEYLEIKREIKQLEARLNAQKERIVKEILKGEFGKYTFGEIPVSYQKESRETFEWKNARVLLEPELIQKLKPYVKTTTYPKLLVGKERV